jgi:hypothetical protein
MSWPNDSHCGFLGRVPITSGVTDSAGRFSVPAGSSEYVLDIKQPHIVFDERFNSNISDWPESLITYLDNPETEFRVRRNEGRSVHLRVYAGDQPVAGAVITISGVNLGRCGHNWMPAATSDGMGDALIRDFYPDETPFICVTDGKEVLWQIDSGNLERQPDPIPIQLPADARGRQTIAGPCG